MPSFSWKGLRWQHATALLRSASPLPKTLPAKLIELRCKDWRFFPFFENLRRKTPGKTKQKEKKTHTSPSPSRQILWDPKTNIEKTLKGGGLSCRSRRSFWQISCLKLALILHVGRLKVLFELLISLDQMPLGTSFTSTLATRKAEPKILEYLL